MAADREQLHLAVALTNSGAGAGADRLVDLVRTAERGTLDFVLFEDSFEPQPDAAGHPRGRSRGGE
jgi:hypothetical protein